MALRSGKDRVFAQQCFDRVDGVRWQSNAVAENSPQLGENDFPNDQILLGENMPK